MQLSELINENAIRLHLAARDKESCIKELVSLLESAHGVNTKGEILSKVLQRESMMSTGIGNGCVPVIAVHVSSPPGGMPGKIFLFVSGLVALA